MAVRPPTLRTPVADSRHEIHGDHVRHPHRRRRHRRHRRSLSPDHRRRDLGGRRATDRPGLSPRCWSAASPTWPTWSTGTASAWWTWGARATRSWSRSRRAGSSAPGAAPPPRARARRSRRPFRVRSLTIAVAAGRRRSGRGDTLVVIEAMKMENEFKASAAGTVAEVRVQPGQAVNPGDVLIVIEGSGQVDGAGHPVQRRQQVVRQAPRPARRSSLSVDAGEVVVVCGPSGSGKSTLIRCVNRPRARSRRATSSCRATRSRAGGVNLPTPAQPRWAWCSSPSTSFPT